MQVAYWLYEKRGCIIIRPKYNYTRNKRADEKFLNNKSTESYLLKIWSQGFSHKYEYYVVT